jgi:hypothetical protein
VSCALTPALYLTEIGNRRDHDPPEPAVSASIDLRTGLCNAIAISGVSVQHTSLVCIGRDST